MDDIQFLHRSFEKPLSPLSPRVVLIEEDLSFGKKLKYYLEKELNLKTTLFTNSMQCLKDLRPDSPSFCLITEENFKRGRISTLSLIDLLKEKGYSFVSIVIKESPCFSKYKCKDGLHYMEKTLDLENFKKIIPQAFKESLGINIIPRKTIKANIPLLSTNDIFQNIVGHSDKMKVICDYIKRVAKSDSTILIIGPSGSGKKMIAKAIQNLSKRRHEKQISVNCGSIPSELLESELFGHIKGPFTGSTSDRKGRLELAHRGTLFMNEIMGLPFPLQIKFLRMLQEKKVEPVGCSQGIPIDVRIIATTNNNIEESVAQGHFREDLFAHLNHVIPIVVPPLSERREDIPLLISFFLSKFADIGKENHIGFDEEAFELLINYHWPGNVRELENMMERLIFLKRDRDKIILKKDLPEKCLANQVQKQREAVLMQLPDDGIDLKDVMNSIENSLIHQALAKTGGNKNRASKLLNINRTTLFEKMKKKGIAFETPQK